MVNINDTTERNTITEEIKVEEEVVEKVQSSAAVVVEVVVDMSKGIAKVETVPYVADSDKNETQNVRSINVENTKAEKADQGKEGPIVIKSEEKIVVETKGREINPKTEKIDNTVSEKITTERIITERRIQDRKEKPEEVILNNDKDIKVVNARESKIVAKEVILKKIQMPNLKTAKEVRNNVLPFKTRDSKTDLKNVEAKATKPAVEKN